MVSSFQFREATAAAMCRKIRSLLPGEIACGHLFFDPASSREIARQNVVHYFIYRDPRAVVVSEAHDLWEMNRWHRLSPHFRQLETLEDAITFAIRGFERPLPGIDYPNIAARFARYRGWLESAHCLAVRYEDLCSAERPRVIEVMASCYRSHARDSMIIEAMTQHIQPHRSHTFRSGHKSSWEREFKFAHRRLFDQAAGNLLIDLGYEHDHAWVTRHRSPTSNPQVGFGALSS